MNNSIKFYALQKCFEISDKCHNNFNPNNELVGQLQELSQFIDIFNSPFRNCSCVFKENKLSCVFKENSSALSGYYTIQAPNGSLISVYCDMEGSSCDGKEGWVRVGYLNMSKPNATCSPGLYTYNFSSINHPLCDRFNSSSGDCNSAVLNTHGISYQRICGQVREYQYRIADGIYPNDNNNNDNIDGYYVDGISITHCSNPLKHKWTYVCGNSE